MNQKTSAKSADHSIPPDPRANPADQVLERLAALVPALVRRLLEVHPPQQLQGWHERAEVACVFADISGFTPLVETLASRGKPGLESLRQVLIACFGALLAVTDRYGGEVLRFAGDAMTVTLRRPEGSGPALLDAMECGLALQQAMTQVQAGLPKGLPALGLKVGVGAGPVSFTIVGESAMVLVADGPGLHSAIEAEHVLKTGEIGLDLRALPPLGPTSPPQPLEVRDGHIGILDRPAVDGLRGQFLQAGVSSAGPVVAPLPVPPAQRLAPFLLEPLYQRILSGSMDLLYEHRRLRVVFLRFDGIDSSRPEDVPRLHRYFTEAEAIVRRQGGFLTEMDVGDKGSNLVAVFGAPAAVEAPWEAAGRSALEMLDLSRRHGLIARAGLGSGPAFCGETGAAHRLQYAVFGEAINRSARLMAKARPGEVLADPNFVEESRDAFTFEMLPPQPLKGFAQPVVLARVVGTEEQANPQEGPLPERKTASAQESPFLGRKEELDQLEEAWQRTSAGQGRAVALLGPAGIGKSRLLRQLTRTLAGQAAILVARGRREESGVPFAAFRNVLERLLPPETEGSGGSLLERLMDTTHGGRQDIARDPQAALQSAVAAADRLLEALVTRQPVLLIAEDLQWMDEASRLLLQDQSRVVAQRREMLLLSARSAKSLAGLEARTLELQPWDTEEVRQAALGHLRATSLDRDLERLLVRLGQGNPLMVEELCRHLLALNRVQVSEYGQAYLSSPIEEDLPGSVEALMLARLDRLPTGARRLLQVASCLTGDLETGLLARVSASDPGTTEALLESAQAEGLLTRTQQVWSFRQSILRETIHGALSRADLQVLHDRIAADLEAQEAAGQPIEAARLAYHCFLADRKRAAYLYSRQAADQARQQAALTEVLGHLDRAIELLDSGKLRPEKADLPELLAQRAETFMVTGNPDRVAEDAQRLVRVATRRKQVSWQTQGWICLAKAHEARSRYEEGRKAAQKALHSAQESQSPLQISDALTALAKLDFHQGRFDSALHELNQALEISIRSADSQRQADNYYTLGRTYTRINEFLQAENHQKSALEISERQKDITSSIRSRLNLVAIALMSGQPQSALEHCLELLESSRQVGSRKSEATACQYLATIYIRQGDGNLAETYLRQSIASYHRAGDLGGMASSVNNLGTHLHLQHRWQEAEARYREAQELCQRSGNAPLLCIFVNNLAELYEDCGEPQRAALEYENGLRLAREMSNSEQEIKSLLGLARQSARTGQAEDATRMAKTALMLAEKIQIPEWQRSALETLQSIGNPISS